MVNRNGLIFHGRTAEMAVPAGFSVHLHDYKRSPAKLGEPNVDESACDDFTR